MKTLCLIIVLLITTCLFSTIINIPADQPTIQAGIDVAVNVDTVLVQPGTYVENINYNGKNITVASLFLTTADTTYISQTIIDGDSLDSVVKFESGEDSTAVLTGLTITNGFSDWGNDGGGIYCINSSPSFENMIISSNITGENGGGIACINSSPNLVNVTITGNTTVTWGTDGGGVYCVSNSNPSFENVTITDNSVTGYGGGIYCDDSSLSFENVTIADNYTGSGIYCVTSSLSLFNVIISGNYGGGIRCAESSLSLENVTITDNDNRGIVCAHSSLSLVNVIISDHSTNSFGGGIYCWESSPSLMNVTITNNTADEGGGIYCEYNSNPSLINCILWNNIPQEIYFDEDDIPNSATVSYSDIQDGEAGIVTNNNGTVYWEEGNIDEEPLFVGSGEHPYSLFEDSPCIDVGIPDTTGLNLPEFDLAGNPRIYGGRIDIGAYENQNVVVGANEDLIPLITKLNQNYPNPFNPTTTINYSLKEDSKISLSIYNIRGQKVRLLVSDQLSAGQHSAIWNGKDDNNKSVSSGIYFYKLKTENFEKTKKMILMK